MEDDNDEVSNLSAMDSSPSNTERNSINGAVSGRSGQRLHNIATRVKANSIVELKSKRNHLKEFTKNIISPLSIFSPDRNKSAAACDEIVRDISHDDKGISELYFAPTKLHKACLSASSFEDFRYQITSSYSSDRAITVDIQKKDVNGRNPFHLLALNKKLASSIANEEQEDDDADANLNIAKAAQISDFVLKFLLPTYPPLLLDSDNNGFLPFEEIIVHWIESVESVKSVDRQLPLKNLISPRTWLRKISSRDSDKGQSTLFTKSSSNSSDSERVYTNTNSTEGIPLSPLRECKSCESPSLDTDRLRSETNLNQISEPQQYTNCVTNGLHNRYSTEVQPTLQLKYVLYLLSAIVDYLGKEEIVVENGKVEHTRSRRSLLTGSRASSERSIDGSCFSHETQTPVETSRHSCEEDMDRSESLCDTRSNLLSKFASTSDIIKSLLLISDISEKDIIFQYSVVRGIMLQKESIGKWLTSMLQSREAANHAIEYLQLLSDVIKEETQSSQQIKETDKKANELYDELCCLHDLIPSMIALDDKIIEKVAVTPVISNVLDRIITTPFAACLIFFDVLALVMLIFTFGMSTNDFLLGKDPGTIYRWIYSVNCFAFYFILRELGKIVALRAIMTRRLFLKYLLYNGWNMVDIISILMTIASTLTIRVTMADWVPIDGNQKTRTLLAITIALLYLKFLGILKTINKKLATFTLAIVKITRDIAWYFFILGLFIIMFSQMFYALLVPADCYGKSSDDKCAISENFLSVYVILLGEFDTEEYSNNQSLYLFIIFSVLVVIVLLNVLIAIISDSYERCAANSKGLFGRLRIFLIAEIISFQGLFRNSKEDSAGCHLGWIRCKWEGFTFICLATFVVTVWTIGEFFLQWHGFSDSDHPFYATFSIAANVAILAIVLIVLSRSGEHKSLKDLYALIHTPIRNITLRLLGTTEYLATQGPEVDKWGGRLSFLQKEISRSATKTSELNRVLMKTELTNSNRRMKRRILSLENQLVKSEENMIAQVQGSEERMHKMVKEYMKELCQKID